MFVLEALAGLGFGCEAGLGSSSDFGLGFAADCFFVSGAKPAPLEVVSRAAFRTSSRAGRWAFSVFVCELEGALGSSAEHPIDRSNMMHAKTTDAFMLVVVPPNHAEMRLIVPFRMWN